MFFCLRLKSLSSRLLIATKSLISLKKTQKCYKVVFNCHQIFPFNKNQGLENWTNRCDDICLCFCLHPSHMSGRFLHLRIYPRKRIHIRKYFSIWIMSPSNKGYTNLVTLSFLQGMMMGDEKRKTGGSKSCDTVPLA